MHSLLKTLSRVIPLCLAASCAIVNAQEKSAQHDHDHGDEVALGTFQLGDYKITAAQGHGKVEPGKEGHLVIKLPYNDKGQSVVRIWIGSSDRTLSTVGKAIYTAAHNDYDVHTVAPSPLPKDCKWWIEIRKPDGKRIIGSIPLLRDKDK